MEQSARISIRRDTLTGDIILSRKPEENRIDG